MVQRKQLRTILISLLIAIGVVAIGFVSGDVGVLGNMLIIAVVIAVVPIFISKYFEFMYVRELERQFPGFVRDLADSRRSGMSFPESIAIATKAHYGKLTDEIIHMHNRLSWGISFIRVLEGFQERTKHSRLLKEAITIIKESYKSGGDIASTLDSIARDMVMLKEAESERTSIVREHVLIMYGIFFMFVGIAIMIIFVMVPMIQAQPETTTGTFTFTFTNPCEGLPVFPCDAFFVVGNILGVTEGIATYYISLFFIVVVVQGIFTGLIAGQLGENSIMAGAKHSLVMTIAGIGIFLFIARAGFLPL